MPGKAFEAQDFEAFLAALPQRIDGQSLRHVVDVRHESFMTSAYLAQARRYKVAPEFTDADKLPPFADVSGDPVYARLMMSDAGPDTGYADAALNACTERARLWVAGRAPHALPSLEEPPARARPRDMFIYFFNGPKAPPLRRWPCRRAQVRAPQRVESPASRMSSQRRTILSRW